MIAMRLRVPDVGMRHVSLPAVPREGDTIFLEQETYRVTAVIWFPLTGNAKWDTDNAVRLEGVQVLVDLVASSEYYKAAYGKVTHQSPVVSQGEGDGVDGSSDAS
jgi:hypothetical protein